MPGADPDPSMPGSTSVMAREIPDEEGTIPRLPIAPGRTSGPLDGEGQHLIDVADTHLDHEQAVQTQGNAGGGGQARL